MRHVFKYTLYTTFEVFKTLIDSLGICLGTFGTTIHLIFFYYVPVEYGILEATEIISSEPFTTIYNLCCCCCYVVASEAGNLTLFH